MSIKVSGGAFDKFQNKQNITASQDKIRKFSDSPVIIALEKEIEKLKKELANERSARIKHHTSTTTKIIVRKSPLYYCWDCRQEFRAEIDLNYYFVCNIKHCPKCGSTIIEKDTGCSTHWGYDFCDPRITTKTNIIEDFVQGTA